MMDTDTNTETVTDASLGDNHHLSSWRKPTRTGLAVCPCYSHWQVAAAALLIVTIFLVLSLVVVVMSGDQLIWHSDAVYSRSVSRVNWSREFFPSYTESSLEVQDMNRDGVLDVIMAHMSERTYDDGYNLCPGKTDFCKENVGFSPCRVQLVAMSGTTGEVIWEKWTDLEIFAIRCSHDLNSDKIPDCVVAGRTGTFAALNGVDGSLLWTVD